MKKVSAILLGLLLGCVIIIAILWWVMDAPNRKQNGFTRRFLTTDLPLIKSAQTDGNLRLLSGISESTIYYSTFKKGEIAYSDHNLTKFERKEILADTILLGKLKKSNEIIVDSPSIYLIQGSAKMIAKTDFQRSAPVVYKLQDLFTRVVPMSENALIVRKFKKGVLDQFLYKYDLKRDTVSNERAATAPSTDGGLMTGGMISYDRATHHGVYVHYYCNKLVLLDSNLNIIKTGATIDTFSHYTIRSNKYQNNGKEIINNAGPTRFVNRASCVSNGILYIYSEVRANNEAIEEFYTNKRIDLYDMSDLQYKGSYRLKGVQQNKIRNILAAGDHLVLLFANQVRVYNIGTNALASNTNIKHQ